MQPQTHYSLVRIMLRNLAVLLLSIGFGVATGWGLTQLQTPMWKSTAQFDKPLVTHLGNYYSLFSIYTLLNGGHHTAYKVTTLANGTAVLVPELSHFAEETATEKSFQEFKRMLTSPDVLHQFLTQNELIKQTASQNNMPVALLAQEISTQFSFESKTDRLSVLSANPKEAAQLLTGFITFANAQAVANLNAELVAVWKTLFQQTKQAAEIKLGAIQQGSQIAQQDWAGKLNLMLSVQPLDNKLEAFRFVQSPTVPLQPHTPAVSLWMMIGGLVGLVLGLLIVSVSSLSRRKNHG